MKNMVVGVYYYYYYYMYSYPLSNMTFEGNTQILR